MIMRRIDGMVALEPSEKRKPLEFQITEVNEKMYERRAVEKLNSENSEAEKQLQIKLIQKNDEELCELLEKLTQHKPWYAENEGRWKIHIKDKRSKTGRAMIAKANIVDLCNEVIVRHCYSYTLADIFECYQADRIEKGIAPKTITEDKNEWKRTFAKHKISSALIREIELKDIHQCFLDILGNDELTVKRFSASKSLLSRLFEFAMIQNYIPFNENPVKHIRKDLYRGEFKADSDKKFYTFDERTKILRHVTRSTDPLDKMIGLAFQMPIRISELATLKFEDRFYMEGVKENGTVYKYPMLHLQRSLKRIPVLDENRSEYKAVDTLKGKARAGYRKIPLSTEANEIFDSLLDQKDYMTENCVNEMKGFLFKSSTGQFVTDDTFNRKLKAVCNEVGVEYKSSHAIRFTTATLLFNAGIELTEISKIMGHQDLKTTIHYICRSELSEQSVKRYIDVMNALNAAHIDG